MRGRWVKLSIPRRIVTDLMYFSADLPSVVVQRPMVLAAAAAAREAHPQRPSWAAIFTKAYAMLAAEFPELRRAYVRLPYPHLYEYRASVASVVIERDFGGEMGLAFLYIKEPAALPIEEVSRLIRHAKSEGYVQTRRYRQMMRIARLPLLVRRSIWWVALNLPRPRANQFGTFAVSAVSSTKAEIIGLRSPLTSVVTYGFVGADGSVTVRIVFDHRVLDARALARALGRLEDILNGPIADELRGRREAASIKMPRLGPHWGRGERSR